MSISEKIAQHYNAIAKGYAEHAYLAQQTFAELFERLQLLNIPFDEILDLGCGNGYSLEYLSKHFPKANLHFLDISAKMLELVMQKRNLKQRVIYRPKFHLHDIDQNSLPEKLAEESLSLVLANIVLPYVNSIENSFEKIQKLLNPNGVFCFSSFGPDSFQELRMAMQSVLENDANKDKSAQIAEQIILGQLVDMHILGDGLLKAGFREPVMDVERLTLHYSSFEALWMELTGAGLVIADLHDEQKNVIAKAYQQFCTEDAHWPVTVEVVYGQAWANSNQAIFDSRQKQQNGEVYFPLDQIKRR